MARQLRIEYPGAFYHVVSRGNQKQPIVKDDSDKAAFINYLSRANEKFRAIFHAFCLMENHYHLIIETPHGNLSMIMHFINTSYTIYFNKKHDRVGHLFQGRFKAILIETDSYAQELSRYMHLNPVRAEIVALPEEYPWSSYREYAGQRGATPWLNTALVLGYFGDTIEKAKKRYKEYVHDAIDKRLESPLKKAGPSLILGSEDFLARIKKEFLLHKTENREVPAIRSLKEKPALELILRIVERELGGINRFTRNMAIFLCRGKTDYPLREIAAFYRISPSAIVKISRQMKERLACNKALENALEVIEKSLFG